MTTKTKLRALQAFARRLDVGGLIAASEPFFCSTILLIVSIYFLNAKNQTLTCCTLKLKVHKPFSDFSATSQGPSLA